MSSQNSVTFNIHKMNCGSCVGRVEKALLAVPGVQGAAVNLAAETATVVVGSDFDMGVISTALDTAGYPAELQTFRFSVENMSWRPAWVGLSARWQRFPVWYPPR